MRPAGSVVRPAVAVLAAAAMLTACSATSGRPGRSMHPSTSAGAGAASTPGLSATAERTARRGFAALEKQFGARLGVAVTDTGSGARLTYRGTERFPFASTDKTFIAAATLHASSAAALDTVVHYPRRDLLAYAPITSRHVGTGMTVRALIDAALRYSDNTAANLLVDRLGGPGHVQRFLHSIGDTVTRVDRLEPELNTAVPGDPRDTTTPAAFAADLDRTLLGTALDTADRSLLDALMTANTTGGPYVRAGVPAGWVVADKTGNADYGTRNDIAVVRPPGRAPIVVVLFSTRRAEDAASQDTLLADATRVAVRALS